MKYKLSTKLILIPNIPIIILLTLYVWLVFHRKNRTMDKGKFITEDVKKHLDTIYPVKICNKYICL